MMLPAKHLEVSSSDLTESGILFTDATFATFEMSDVPQILGR
jgi:hypothetical protein